MENAITIHCNNIRLKGMLNPNSSGRGVVVTHLHPFTAEIWTTLWWNRLSRVLLKEGLQPFASISGGQKTVPACRGEADDVRASLDYLKALGIADLYLAGYSFGARMNASVVSSGYKLSDNIMVSPPMGFMSFDDAVSMPSTGLIITGADDKIAPSAMVQAAIKRWQISPRFEVIEGCDHFYTTGMTKLRWILSDYLA